MKTSALLSAAIAICISSSVYADTLNIYPGWQMMGATSNGIVDMGIFDSPCIKAVYAYRSGAYYMHTASGVNTLSSLNPNEGYWINGNGSCQINTSSTPPVPPGTTTTAIGITQADVDANVSKAKTGCFMSPISCGIMAKYTDTDLANAKAQTIAACVTNPASCRVNSSGMGYMMQ